MRFRWFLLFIAMIYSHFVYADSIEKLFTNVKTLPALEQQLALAKEKQKPAVVEFYASWCSVCRGFDQYVLSDGDVQKRLQSFSVIRVDVTEQNEDSAALFKRYDIYGTPAFIFYDKNGNEVTSERVTGGPSKPMFMGMLKKVDG